MSQSSYRLEYEITQNKIDNYGKTTIQIRGIALTITGVLLTYSIQSENFYILILLGVILAVLLYMENEQHIQQNKLIKHIFYLERNFRELKKHRFTLGKELIKPILFVERKKNLRKSSFLILLFVVNLFLGGYQYINQYGIDSDVSKFENEYKQTIERFYILSNKLININEQIDKIKVNKENLYEDIDEALLKKQKFNKEIWELQKIKKQYEIEIFSLKVKKELKLKESID